MGYRILAVVTVKKTLNSSSKKINKLHNFRWSFISLLSALKTAMPLRCHPSVMCVLILQQISRAYQFHQSLRWCRMPPHLPHCVDSCDAVINQKASICYLSVVKFVSPNMVAIRLGRRLLSLWISEAEICATKSKYVKQLLRVYEEEGWTTLHSSNCP